MKGATKTGRALGIIAVCAAAIALCGNAAAEDNAASDSGQDATLALDNFVLDNVEQAHYTEDNTPVGRAELSSAKALHETGRQLALEGIAGDKYLAAKYTSDGRRRADVIFISSNANVTTTKCLFLIVSGYLEAATEHGAQAGNAIDAASTNAQDAQIATAAMLEKSASYAAAERICWWNSAHYGDSAYFASIIGNTNIGNTHISNTQSVDGTVPASGITQGSGAEDNTNADVLPFSDRTHAIGLSPSYKDWAGGTRIVIPWAVPTASRDGEDGLVVVDETLVSSTADGGHNEVPQAEDAPYRPKDTYTTENDMAERLSVPSGFMIMLAAVAIAIVTLIMLLIKVIMDLARDRG